MTGSPTSFEVVAERSAILIRARSNVGPIEFATTRIAGTIGAAIQGSTIDLTSGVACRLEIDVDSLRSGSSLYDAELHRRVDSRFFPLAVLELQGSERLAAADLFQVSGELTFHGVTRSLTGVVDLSIASGHKLVITGEQVVDIRDFDISSPTLLMLKIYPDVRVYLHLEAESDPEDPVRA
jgi:hypothetical protein